MNCSCPKCEADIQVDASRITEAGTSTSCPVCKSRFWMIQEPFVLRAYRKAGSTYCGKCGSQLGLSNMCTACGEFFPSYRVVQSSKPVRRKAVKEGFSFNLSLKPARKGRAFSPESTRTSRKPLLALLGLVAVVAVLAVAIGSFFLNMKAEQQFSRNYVLALYGIKSGADRSLNALSKTSVEWKAKTDSGQVFILRVTPEEKADLNEVKDEVDKVMQQLNAPPEKFVAANDRLVRLYQVYLKLYALNLTPPATLPDLTNAVGKLDGDFNRAGQELKAGLPEELLEEIRKVAPRYKNLQFILAK